jgi:hypothetical protein
MLNWMRNSLVPTHASKHRADLQAESLEDRTTPTVSAITSEFNGTAIPAGDSVWFSSVAKVSGLGATPATVHVTDQTISFTANGTPYTLDVPDSTIVFSPTTSSASLAYDGTWEVASPSSFSGNVFLSGVGAQFAAGLPGGIKNVTWSGNFTSDTSGLTIKWQWAAAAYKQFSADPSALNVKPSDAQTTAYHNSDHAGTPEAFKSAVVGGARGGGGSNFTGSMSSTAAVVADLFVPPSGGGGSATGSLSGFVYLDRNQDGIIDTANGDHGIAGVTIELIGVNDLGQTVDLITTTDSTGAYSFTGLRPGTYSLSESQPAGYTDGADYLGSLGGTPQDDQFFNIALGAGQTGVNYNYTEFLTE